MNRYSRSRRLAHCVIAVGMVLVGSVLAGSAKAQSVRGMIVDAAGAPIAGALAVLMDSTTPLTSRAISNERGEVFLRAPSAGVFRVQVYRIGFQPRLSEPVTVSAGAAATVRIIVDNLGLRLDTMRVAARSTCRVLPTNSGTFALWQQARTAIVSTMTGATDARLRASLVTYERTLDRTTDRIRSQQLAFATVTAGQPWSSPAPATLIAEGYVSDGDDSTTYFAPGLDLLASDEFIAGHCFRLVASRDSALIGIAFEPAATRRRADRRPVVDIRGTLWLTRRSAELQRVEFTYTNLDRLRSRHAGGSIDLVRLRNQAWAVSRWAIRMPVVTRRRTPAGGYDPEYLLAAIQVRGGELVLLTTAPEQAESAMSDVAMGNVAIAGVPLDTIWQRASLMVHGVVTDSITGVAVPDAQVTLVGTNVMASTDARGAFTLSDVLPGAYDIQVRSPLLRRIGAVSQSHVMLLDSTARVEVRLVNGQHLLAALCPAPRGQSSAGRAVIMGTVLGGAEATTSQPTRVVAEWHELEQVATSRVDVQRRLRYREVETNADGDFRICGVPTGLPVTVRAIGDSASSAPMSLTLTDDEPVARADVMLDVAASRTGTLTGVVMTDAPERPVSDAEITLPDMGITARSDARGAFRLTDVPPGRHTVVVRGLGYSPLETTLEFAPNQTDERRIQLSRVTVLDSVTTEATAHLTDFEEHRRVGLGRFLTPADMRKLDGFTLAAAMESLGGVGVVRGRGASAWLIRSRGPTSLTGASQTTPNEFDRSRGAGTNCYAHVWLDGVPVYLGRDDETLFDLSSISPSEIDAIEYYAGPAQTPGKYNGNKSACGVVVIWRRR